MRTVLCTELGNRAALKLAESAAPSSGPGQVRILVHAAGLNFADLLIVDGKYQEKPALPFTPGMETAGTVAEIGPDVAGFAIGDRVLGVGQLGGYADEAVLDAIAVLRIPDTMGFEAAAGFPIAYGTAHGALAWRARLQPGETLLVHGASGGTGLAAVEIGALLGAKVIATASSDEKLEIARSRGAAHALRSNSPDLVKQIRGIVGPQGVSVVFDPVGGALFEASLRVIAWEGRLVVIGFAGGAVQQIPANILLVKNCDAIGFYWGSYQLRNPLKLRDSLATVLGWVAEGRIVPHVSARFPLDRVADALDLLASRRSTGKIVLATGR